MIMQTQNRLLKAQKKIHRKLKILTCWQCGDVVLVKHRWGRKKRYCSDKCKDLHKWSNQSYEQKEMKRIKAKQKRAEIALLQAKTVVGQCGNCSCEMTGRRRKFCSAACCTSFRHRECDPSVRKCKQCDVMFRRKTERSYCSDDCRTRAWSRTCKDCGIQFTQKKNCSGKCKACRKHDRNRSSSVRLRVRRGKVATAVAKISVHDCWDRDGGKCQICKKRIDLSVKWPHRNSMSVDHIVPLSKGGTDEASNVRAAHLGCNSRRGNKQGVQKRLF